MDFLSRLFRDSGSKEAAVERLRLVLVHDRAQVSPGLLETLKEELIQVISKYMDIDEKGMVVQLNSSDQRATLMANIPVRRVKR
ncbi:MAG TPA: cell division topological specificity factor MinE [Bacillota bacterium]|nr:cell division topological specificity factor MinE [Bacillota bacterium]HPT67408.1 cell division topological specificity factor MinE [Bacillota bacterium]